MKKNTKKYNYRKRPFWQWLLLYIIIGGIIYAGFYYFFFKNNGYNYSTSVQYTEQVSPIISAQPTIQLPHILIKAELNTLPTWNTYTNQQYHFQITYPAKGIDLRQNRLVTCGMNIYEETTVTSNELKRIYFDNFFSVIISKSDESLETYMNTRYNDSQQQFINTKDSYRWPPLHSLYTIEQLDSSRADEAVRFRTGAFPPEAGGSDNAPFAGTLALYKKGSLIIQLFKSTQSNSYGCSLPNALQTKYIESYGDISLNDYANLYSLYQNWVPVQSLQLTN